MIMIRREAREILAKHRRILRTLICTYRMMMTIVLILKLVAGW